MDIVVTHEENNIIELRGQWPSSLLDLLRHQSSVINSSRMVNPIAADEIIISIDDYLLMDYNFISAMDKYIDDKYTINNRVLIITEGLPTNYESLLFWFLQQSRINVLIRIMTFESEFISIGIGVVDNILYTTEWTNNTIQLSESLLNNYITLTSVINENRLQSVLNKLTHLNIDVIFELRTGIVRYNPNTGRSVLPLRYELTEGVTTINNRDIYCSTSRRSGRRILHKYGI